MIYSLVLALYIYVTYATIVHYHSLSHKIKIIKPMFVFSSNSFLGTSLHSIPKTHTSNPPPSPPCVKVRRPNLIAAYTTAATSFRTLSADMASPSLSLYEVLGIPMSATGNEIKAAYRKLARTCHPDVAAVSHRDTSSTEFIKIHAAYSTLSDPNKRAVYDRDLFSVRQRFGNLSASSAAAVSGFTGYTRRNWETDQCW